MTKIANAPVLIRRATEEEDGSSDEDPGPSFFHILTECDGCQALDDIEPAMLRAYKACTDRLPAISGKDVTLLLSTDDAVAALNGRYRGQEKTTNVLSFPAAPLSSGAFAGGGCLPLGDIIIAYETVIREAAEAGKPPLFHLSHLAVHGILHLAGFDHETDSEAEQMERLESQILGAIGMPDPYSTNLEQQPLIAD
jgi:probable rRNA maturation factor